MDETATGRDGGASLVSVCTIRETVTCIVCLLTRVQIFLCPHFVLSIKTSYLVGFLLLCSLPSLFCHSVLLAAFGFRDGGGWLAWYWFFGYR